MNSKHLVAGHTGEQDSINSWAVQAYDSEEDAKKHAAAAQAWADKVQALFESRGDIYFTALLTSGIKSPFDASYSPGDTGARYSVVPMPAAVTTIDLALIDVFPLTQPTAKNVAQCLEILGPTLEQEKEEVARHLLLSMGADPEGEVDGQLAWQAVASCIPTQQPAPPARTLNDIWGKGIPAMPVADDMIG